MAKGKWKKYKTDEVRAHMQKHKHAARSWQYRKKQKEKLGYNKDENYQRLYYANNKKKILKMMKKKRVAARK